MTFVSAKFSAHAASSNLSSSSLDFILADNIRYRAFPEPANNLFRTQLWGAKQDWPVSVFAYNLTSNHVHLLLAAEAVELLGGFMAKVVGDHGFVSSHVDMRHVKKIVEAEDGINSYV